MIDQYLHPLINQRYDKLSDRHSLYASVSELFVSVVFATLAEVFVTEEVHHISHKVIYRWVLFVVYSQV